MNIKKTLLLIIIFVSSTLFAKSFDFRTSNWGMNANDVTLKEGNPTSRKKNGNFYTISYEKQVAGLKANTEFKFLLGNLGKGSYYFKVKYKNNNDYIYDFKKLRKALINKYGNPKESDPEIWANKTHKSDPDNYGLAVGEGHLTYVANWEKDQTKILLQLKGENQKYRLTLTYTSEKYQQKIKELNRKKSSEGL